MSFHAAGPLVACALVLGGTAVAAPALSLEASPRQLLAGRDDVASLVVRGTPEQLRGLRLGCTAGTVRRLRSINAQHLRAEYVPPRSSAATWVLCGAVGGGGATASVGLALQRREVLALNGLPSLSRVLVKMGEALYGPVRANAVGYAEVPVVLTPGVPQAEIQATPPGKPTETRPHALSVVTASQLLLLTAAPEVVADGARGLGVWAFTLGEDGAPQDLPVTFSSSEGALSMKRAGTGVWAGLYTPRARIAPGEATLSARLPNARPLAVKVGLLEGLRPRLALEAPQGALEADGISTIELKVRVADQLGKALAGQPVRLSAQRGRVGPVEERAPGVYVAQYTTPSGAGPVQITAEIPGAEPATLALDLLPPPRITIDVQPRQLPADGESRAILTIIARDAQGHELTEGTPLVLSSTLGTLPARVPTSGGRARVELVAGKASGDATISVTALDASARTSVQFLPGAPAKVVLRSEDTTVYCDGRDNTDLHLFVRDANDNGLDGVPIRMAVAGSLEGGSGRFDRVAALGKGEFIVRYHAPADCKPGPLAVQAVAGGARGETRLQLSRAFPRLMGLSARVGAQSNLSGLLFSALELEGDANVGLLADRLLASASVQLAYGDFSFTGRTGSGTFDARVRMLLTTLSIGPRWTVLESDRLSAYLGAGVDGHLLQASERLILATDHTEEHIWAPPVVGGHVRAGLGVPVGPGLIIVQVRYGLAQLHTPLLRINQLAGLSASAGYRLAF